MMRNSRAFTLVELLIVIAVAAVLLMLAAPSFRDLIEVQRLRGVSAQLGTDVQFARSEAASRQEVVGISFDTVSGSMTCYIVYACGSTAASGCTCDCKAAAGSRCLAPRSEIRTVQLASSAGVSVQPALVDDAFDIASRVSFDPSTGGLTSYYVGGVFAGVAPEGTPFWALASLTRPATPPTIRTEINSAGRPRACAPGGGVSGVDRCAGT